MTMLKMRAALQPDSRSTIDNNSNPDPFADPLPGLRSTVLQPVTPPTAPSVIGNTTPLVTLTIRSPSTGRTQREIDFQLSKTLPASQMDESPNQQLTFYINPATLDVLDYEEIPEAKER